MNEGISAPEEQPVGGTTPGAPLPCPGRPKIRRRLAIAAMILVVFGLAGWAVREPITAWMEVILIRHFHEQGMYPRYSKRSWLPWRGFRFENVVLHRDAAEDHPVVELSALTVAFPWKEIWDRGGMITRWRTKNAQLTLHDDAGAVSFDHVTGAVYLRGQELDISKLELHQSPVSWSLSGKILLAAPPEQNPVTPRNFSVDLTFVRAVLARMAFRPDRGQFAIQGTFSMDFRNADPIWQAGLKATGKAVEWEGVPFREAALEAQLSGTGIQMTSTLTFTKGSAKITVSRTDWDRSPVLIAGHFSDGIGHTDSISGSFDHASGGVAVTALDGPVNLFEFARNFPVLVPLVTVGVRVRNSPEIVVKDFHWQPGAPATWSVGSIQVQSPADLTLTIGGKPLTIDRLSGQAAFKDNTWRFSTKTGRLAWSDLAARETKLDGEFTPKRLSVDASLSLAKGSIDLAVAREAARPGSYAFTGKLTDAAGAVDRFSARYEAGSLTTVVPQLEGKANLVEFASNFRAAAARLPEGWQIRTFPDLLVKDFSYKAGQKAGSWSVASVQLRSAANVTVTTKGRALAVDQLTGSGGFDGKAWRLSKVAGQAMGGRFALDGLYEGGVLRQSTLNLNKLRMEQLSPWIGTTQTSLGEGLVSLDYRGALATEPAQWTGSGTIEIENAPFVKVPLLDQTYDLFSAGAKRPGTGELKATFAAASGVFTISDFAAKGDSVSVTAKGKLDLVRREVSARAWGNLRGVAGLATLAVSRTLEMKVSGPLDQIRVESVGPVKAVGGTITGAGKLLETGVTAPFKMFDWLKSEPPKR